MTFDAFTDAWNLLWKHVGTWLLMHIVDLVIRYAVSLPLLFVQQQVLSQKLQEVGPRTDPFFMFYWPEYWLFVALGGLLSVFTLPLISTFGMAGVRALRGEVPNVGMLFEFKGRYWQLVQYWLLYLVIYCGLTLCFVIPGIVFYVLMVPASLIVLEQGLAPMEAMRVSAKACSSGFWAILGGGIVACLAALLGLLGCGIGVFVTIPVLFLFMGAVYHQLFSSSDAPPPPWAYSYHTRETPPPPFQT